MTIALVVNIPEGIILASDSQSTLSVNVSIPLPDSKIGSVNYRHPSNKFDSTQKIFEISTNELTMGVLQFGTGHPGGRPLSSHIYSLREIFSSSEISTIREGRDTIIQHFTSFDPLSIKGLGFYLVGYDITNSEYKFAGYRLSWGEETDCKIDGLLDEYGANWSGSGGWIVTKLMNLQDEELNIAPAVIPWQYLSLANGVELCDFLIQTVVGFEKFQSKFPTCGGSSQISVITPKDYTEVKTASDFAV